MGAPLGSPPRPAPARWRGAWWGPNEGAHMGPHMRPQGPFIIPSAVVNNGNYDFAQTGTRPNRNTMEALDM